MKNDIIKGSISKNLIFFFTPIFLGALFQQLYNTVDAIIVGNFVGKEALAAVGGSTAVIINLLVGFIMGLSGGVSVVVAQFYGRGDEKNLKRALGSGMFIALILGLFMMIFGYFLTPFFLRFTHVNDQIFPLAQSYMRIYFMGLIPSMTYNTGAGIMRSCGDSRRPFVFLVVAALTNIVLDFVFVLYFKMSVVGVGLATIISQAVSATLTLITLSKTKDIYNFKLKDLKFDKQIGRTILRIGLPGGLQSVMYSVSNVMIQSTINYFSTDTIAAWTAFGKIDAIFWNFSNAVGISVLTIVGQNFGANRIDRVKRTVWIGSAFHALGSIAIAAISIILGKNLVGLFLQDSEVIAIGVEMLRYLAPYWASFVFVEVIGSSIRACGDSFVPMLFTSIFICAFRLVWVLLCDKTTIFTTLMSYRISWVMASVVFLTYYLSGYWLKRCLKESRILSNY